MSAKNSHIVGTVFSVTGLLILSKLLGFAKQLVTAAAFGATYETDLINLSQGLIDNLQYLLIQSVLSALITVYLHTAQEGDCAARRFAFDVWKTLTILAAAVALLVELTAPGLARLIAPGYSAEHLAQLSRYLRLFAPMLLPILWISVFNGLLNANKRFIPAEMISVHQSVFLIVLTVLLSKRLGAEVLVLAFFAYHLWNLGYTAILSRQYWTVSWGNPFRNPAIHRLLQMMLPLLFGYSLVYVNQLVDKALVSGLETGTVTALGYAASLNDLVTSFISTFASMLFAYVAAHVASGDTGGAARLAERAALLLLAAFLPISILTVLQAEDVVTIVYGRGAFNAESIRACALALRGYSLSFAPLALQSVYRLFQYAHQDTRRPMINSSIGIVVNIVLSIALCPRYGVLGVTFATSVSVAVNCVLNIRSAEKLRPELSIRPLLRTLPLLLSGGAACAAAAWLCSRQLAGQSAFVRFVLTTLVSMAVYAVIIRPLIMDAWELLRGGTPEAEAE